MRSISSLLRNEIFSVERATRFKKGLSSDALSKRKQERRLKRMNTFARDYTNQQSPHNWLTSKKIKQIGQYLQTMRNNHPLSNPVSPQIKKEMRQKLQDDSDWIYYICRNEIEQLRQYQQSYQQCNIDELMLQIPTKLRREIQSGKEYERPELVQHEHLYNQQLDLALPLDLRYRFNIQLKAIVKSQNENKQNMQFQQ